jgi:hypothetical protein
MTGEIDDNLMAQEAAREIMATHYPKYLPYFDVMWDAKEHPEKLGKTRGIETVVIQELIGGLFPIVLGIVGAMTKDYIMKKIKKKDQAFIKALIDRSLSDNPKISKDVAADLYKVLPQILERHLASGPVPHKP